VKPRWNKTLVRDYLKTFESPEGKRVLDDLARKCPLLRDTITVTHGVDVNKLLVEEGRRSVLLHIYKMLHRDPNAEAPTRAINQMQGE